MKFGVFNRKRTAKFQSVAIIETDLHFQNTIAEYCRDFGIENISRYDNCEDAWKTLHEEPADLIIIDWFTKGKLTPIGLFNRIKNNNQSVFTPMIVTSGFTEQHDFRLLREFPSVALIEKPFTSGVVYEAFEQLQAEFRWYSGNLRKLNQMLEADKPQKSLKKHMEFILDNSPNPAPMAAMYGRILRLKQFHKEAEEVLRWALGVNPNHVALLNEIGKLYHVTGRHGESLKYLRRAGSLSPDNTKRLCLIGELELGEKNLDDARKSFDSALQYDPYYERAKEGTWLVQSAQDFLGESPGDATTNTSFASLMNTIGINKVRSGRLDDGIKHYRTALNFIEDPHTKAKVMFNIALGFLRHNRIKDALLWFMRSSRTGLGFYDKADAYVQRLSSVFVLTDDGGERQAEYQVQVVDESLHYEPAELKGDDLDELNYDDFQEDLGELAFSEAEGDDLLNVVGEETLVG
ncbi:response regulator [Pseudobacteriovorax antillogorgiicola]|uniref:CheY chemotaxis protein or a CheY-like REC (Receiver) domain n=1 Tax=Pseudobacteriovorax antillogorgiicola TaxID=1513793 RepID=A0A1Y6CFA0_9BACT|nr:response regulator [Pseudobacteriovorax antillogorgiicola]TCS51691.1 CheY-like chemotaxis protein [Pseudobacteriovorax antillogorgiicola]SMF49111.1 CheY chemotaxis protein or a CheY-like REC (receiver) domain [Pseudobacteriovorax antillogorgiicola]